MAQEQTIKGWFLIDHHDPLDGSIIHLVEVVPENDILTHYTTEDCACIPVLGTNMDGIPLLIHNSFDGREENERHERGN